MVLAVWIVISLILPVWLGFIGLFALGILILLVLLFWIRRSKIVVSEQKSGSTVFEQPAQFRDLSEELKDLFDKEKAKIVEGKVEEKKDKKIVSKKKKVVKIKPKYVASTEGGAYHKDNCRFSKLIKGKYRLENTARSFFTKKKYPACKMCKPGKN